MSFLTNEQTMTIRLHFVLACMLVFGSLNAQDINELKKLGELYYSSGNYSEALRPLLQYQQLKPKQVEIKEKVARCYLELGNVAEAKKYYGFLTAQKRPSAEVYFQVGRLYHLSHDFKKATAFYKQYLASAKKDSKQRAYAKHLIRQCGQGVSHIGRPRPALTENLGYKVNSQWDDTHPILSPTRQNTIYFSTIREGNEGGKMDVEGVKNEFIGKYNADMFVTRLINGEWTGTETFNPALNTEKHDLIQDFTDGGKVLYYRTEDALGKGRLMVDTFTADGSSQPVVFDGPMLGKRGDRDLYFVNDTIILFASEQPGGYGGKDIYIAYKRGGVFWSKPKNLGPQVNSPFDEVSPFLSKDGKAIYFSSDNKRSIGGFDVFKSVYDSNQKRWSKPTSLGMPINSGGDDLHFRLASDGLKAYYSSNRFGGSGGHDIYAAYFKDVQVEQMKDADATAFDYGAPNKGNGIDANAGNEDGQSIIVEEVKEYIVSPLYYTGETVVTSVNTRKLDAVLKMMSEQPRLQVELVSHTDNTAPDKFRLYFSAKRAESVADYLIQNGVNPSDISIRACGDSYPVAKNELDNGAPNTVGQNMNNRIDIIVRNTEGLPIKIINASPKVSDLMKDGKWDYFSNATKGLSYKVQVAAMQQMYDSDIITTYPDATIEMDMSDKKLSYTVGLYQTYSSASQLKNDLIRQGLSGAFVVPYVDGVRTDMESSKIFAGTYPDLLNFIEAKN